MSIKIGSYTFKSFKIDHKHFQGNVMTIIIFIIIRIWTNEVTETKCTTPKGQFSSLCLSFMYIIFYFRHIPIWFITRVLFYCYPHFSSSLQSLLLENYVGLITLVGMEICFKNFMHCIYVDIELIHYWISIANCIFTLKSSGNADNWYSISKQTKFKNREIWSKF